MSESQAPPPIPVDRHEETLVTQQPGFSATEQIIHDAAAERRMILFQINRIVWVILGVLETLLGLRFILKLIGANAESGFAAFMYALTDVFTAPFTGLVASWGAGNSVFEVTTVIAMLVYALVFWGTLSIIPIVFEWPSARVVSRSTHEQGGTGSEHTERTTHTTTST
jgi:hypothetical protein